MQWAFRALLSQSDEEREMEDNKRDGRGNERERLTCMAAGGSGTKGERGSYVKRSRTMLRLMLRFRRTLFWTFLQIPGSPQRIIRRTLKMFFPELLWKTINYCFILFSFLEKITGFSAVLRRTPRNIENFKFAFRIQGFFCMFAQNVENNWELLLHFSAFQCFPTKF